MLLILSAIANLIQVWSDFVNNSSKVRRNQNMYINIYMIEPTHLLLQNLSHIYEPPLRCTWYTCNSGSRNQTILFGSLHIYRVIFLKRMQTCLNGLPTRSQQKAFSEIWILLWQSIDNFTTREANHLFFFCYNNNN